jgi:hypothetical protein
MSSPTKSISVEEVSYDEFDFDESCDEYDRESLNSLETHFLYNDIKRDSLRSRSGTRNFCINPIFEGECQNDNKHEEQQRDSHKNEGKDLNGHSNHKNEFMNKCISSVAENVFLSLGKLRESSN